MALGAGACPVHVLDVLAHVRALVRALVLAHGTQGPVGGRQSARKFPERRVFAIAHQGEGLAGHVLVAPGCGNGSVSAQGDLGGWLTEIVDRVPSGFFWFLGLAGGSVPHVLRRMVPGCCLRHQGVKVWRWRGKAGAVLEPLTRREKRRRNGAVAALERRREQRPQVAEAARSGAWGVAAGPGQRPVSRRLRWTGQRPHAPDFLRGCRAEEAAGAARRARAAGKASAARCR